MNAEQVLEVLDLLKRSGIDPWVDGGWGVDAIVGTQSRSHGDLDLRLSSDQRHPNLQSGRHDKDGDCTR